MIEYPALMDGKAGAYGVSFPDLPGIVAMGVTKDEALLQAEQALRDCAIETKRADEDMEPPSALEQIEIPPGHTLVSVRIPPLRHRRVLVHWNPDAGVAEGRRCGLDSSALRVLEQMIRNSTARP